MRTLLILPLLLLAPLSVAAADPCAGANVQRIELTLDLDGVERIRFETNQFDVRLRATAAAQHVLRGRACARDAKWLPGVSATQEKRDGTLVVRLWREPASGLIGLFGSRDAVLEVEGTVPDDRLVQLVVGSGDAYLEGAASASADVGSGDVELHRIRGPVTVKLGSGDVKIDGAGPLRVLAIGSGDLKAREIAGAVSVGPIGSGDLVLDGVRGDVQIGSIGSGDARLRRVDGAVRIDRVGSGDVDVNGAAGLSVGSVGSGDVRHQGVRGTVDVPRRN